jgi:hypothetical protein
MRNIFVLFFILMFIVGCSGNNTQVAPDKQIAEQPIVTQQPNPQPQPYPPPPIVEDPDIASTQTVVDQQPSEETQCLMEQDNPVARGITAEYDFTTYQQVMEWFCSGAEFEDIMTALETESQSGTPAQEMLVMLADGFSWEEIWQVVGLTE